MNIQENIKILKSIAKKIANKLHCDRHGSCVHFAEIFVDEVNEQYPELLNDFDVIEGYVNVKFGDGIPQEHTWIKLNNGDIIDPTFSQFDKYDKNAQYSKKRTKVYSGQEYYDEGKEGSWFAERRKKLPSSVFKEEKREFIKRILREDTSIKTKLLNTIDKIGFLRTSDIVGGVERLLDIVGSDYLTDSNMIDIIKEIIESNNGEYITLSELGEEPILVDDDGVEFSQIEILYSTDVMLYHYDKETGKDHGESFMDYVQLRSYVLDDIFNMLVDYYINNN